MSVWQDGAGWHTTIAPCALFLAQGEALQADKLSGEAEVYSLEIAFRTLATGERLLEWTCECKVRRNLPYTSTERAYIDRLLSERLLKLEMKKPLLTGLDWTWDKSGGIQAIGSLDDFP